MTRELRKSRFYGVMTKLLAFAVGCLMVVVVLGAAEATLRVKAHFKKPPSDDLKVSDRSMFTDMKTPLGFKPCPNVTIHEKVTRGDRCVYDVNYTIDDHSRRVTPCDSPEARDRVAAFFGCSFTFGNGVQDNETLPARFAAHCPECLPVNFAYTAYGPQQMWLQMEKLDALKDLPVKKGAVIYVFMENHFDRLVGAPSILRSWGYFMPWLRLENGEIQWAGNFEDRTSLQSVWVRYAERFHLVKFLENRMPRRQDAAPSGGAEALLVRLLQECADSVAKTGPDLKFYCMLYPGTSKACCDALRDRLKGCKGVALLDYSELFDYSRIPVETLWYDDSATAPLGHPKPVACDILATRLAGDIGDCK